MSNVGLLPADGPEDLVLRGFPQDAILERTGIDVGYHGNRLNTRLKGIDRFDYKVQYVLANRTRAEILSVLDAYAAGLSKAEVLDGLGIAGENIVKLHKLFRAMGYEAEFRDADKKQRLHSMRTGTEAKYGTDNVFKLAEFQEQAARTREEKYGARYTLCNESSLCGTARATFNVHMKDPEFAAAVDQKKRETMLREYGVEHVMQLDSAKEKSRATSLARYGAEHYSQSLAYREQLPDMLAKQGKRLRVKPYDPEYDALSTLERSRLTSMRRYGVSHHSKSEDFRESMSTWMKDHSDVIQAKREETCMGRYGVPYPMQTDDFRRQQSERMSDPEYHGRIVAAKKRNHTLTSSDGERWLDEFLRGVFGDDDVISQYRDERYPFFCDFYVKSRDMFIELNASWTHGGHWFDGGRQSDADVLAVWRKRAAMKPYYGVAESVWCGRDVEKRAAARAAGLNYLVFWANGTETDEVMLWAAMGCPDARDWDREYSWLPEWPDLTFDAAFPDNISTDRKRMLAAKCANWREFYKREIALWADNYGVRSGTVRARLYANRYKYLGKLPGELTGREILRGMGISGMVRAYSSFSSIAMQDFLTLYGVRSIYDPCAGWGERLLTAGASGIEYLGVDVNPALQAGYEVLIRRYGLSGCHVLHGDSGAFDATGMDHDALFTCPPYGGREIYTADGAENLDEAAFFDWWRRVLVNGIGPKTRVVAYQIDMKHARPMDDVIESLGWKLDRVMVADESVNHMVRVQGHDRRKNREEIHVFVKS